MKENIAISTLISMKNITSEISISLPKYNRSVTKVMAISRFTILMNIL